MGTKVTAEDFHGTPYQQRVHELSSGPYMEFPAVIGIETLSLCNAACSFCPYPTLARKGERMPDRQIARILDDIAGVPGRPPFQVNLSRVNEPFLDSRIWEIATEVERRFPEATHMLFSNGTPLTDDKLVRLASLRRVGFLNLSLNDHRPEAYQATMRLPFARTVERLTRIHEMKVSGALAFPIIVSRVGDDTAADSDFLSWVESEYPAFQGLVTVRSDWLGAVRAPTGPAPDVGCRQWFELHVLADGKEAFCCIDSDGRYGGGSVESRHVIHEVYGHPARRSLRGELPSRRQVRICEGCPLLP